MRRPAWLLVSSVALALAVAGCGRPAPSVVELEEPAHVETVEGNEELHRITLTARAAERIGIRTVEAEGAEGGAVRVPYSSVFYDAEGHAWAYVNDGDPLTFIRTPVEVADVVYDTTGGTAELASGPEAGTAVVSTGVAELFGTEFEVGH